MKKITKNLFVCACALLAMPTLFGMQDQECAHDASVVPASVFAQSVRDDETLEVPARLRNIDPTWFGEELHYAVEHGRRQEFEWLLCNGAPVNHGTGMLCGTPLHVAARYGRVGMIHRLLECGAEKDALTNAGYTPLVCAIHARKKLAINVLIEAGTDVNIPNMFGRTALFEALQCSDIDIIRAVLAAGAHLNVVDRLGETPLEYAVRMDRFDEVDLLLAAGADSNLRDPQTGQTVLHKQFRMAHMWRKILRCKVLERLLASGANPFIPDDEGRTFAQMAATSSSKRMKELWKRWENGIRTVPQRAQKWGRDMLLSRRLCRRTRGQAFGRRLPATIVERVIEFAAGQDVAEPLMLEEEAAMQGKGRLTLRGRTQRDKRRAYAQARCELQTRNATLEKRALEIVEEEEREAKRRRSNEG